MNFIFGVITSLINALASDVNSNWHQFVNRGQISNAMPWVLSVGHYIPFDLAATVTLLMGFAVVTQIIKWGSKLIDWIRG